MLSKEIEAYFEAKRRLFQHHPDFRIVQAGPLTCLHHHPGWFEVDAFYAVDVDPTNAVNAVRDYGPHPNHMIEVFTQAPDTLWEPFRTLGYVPMPGGQAQPFLGRELPGNAAAGDSIVVERRKTPTASEYWVERDGKPVCWGSSVETSQQAIYVYGMETLPAYRRQGLASAVLDRIHAEAAAGGAKTSILCSSRSGLPLYQKAGYTFLAHMQGFVPQKQDGGERDTT